MTRTRLDGVYVVTERDDADRRTHVDIVRAAVSGGARIVQLRDKEGSARRLVEIGRELKRVCSDHDVLFLVNDRVDIARAAGADGVHVGQSDIGVGDIRRIVPSEFVVGVSVSDAKEAKCAGRDGADYVAVSPVFATPTKTDAGHPVGIDGVTSISSAVEVPIAAIGGMDKSRVPAVIRAGADMICVISAVSRASDMEKAVRELVEEVRRAYA